MIQASIRYSTHAVTPNPNAIHPLLGLIGLALLFFPSCTWAQENSLLWKIEGAGIHTSYLFGTIHVLPAADFDLKPKVENALKASSQLVLEVDISNPNMAMEMMQKASMADGTTMDKLLSSPDYATIDSVLRAGMGMSLAMLNTMKPMVISSFLIRNMIEGEPVSFETSLMQIATANEIPIAGLESISEQMAIFDSIPYISQAEDLLDMVHKEAEMKTFYAELIQLYKDEQVAELYEQTAGYIEDESELEHVLYARNKKWIPSIIAFTEAKPSFIGVGAAHLGGDQGVIELLKAAGYKVSAVN